MSTGTRDDEKAADIYYLQFESLAFLSSALFILIITTVSINVEERVLYLDLSFTFAGLDSAQLPCS